MVREKVVQQMRKRKKFFIQFFDDSKERFEAHLKALAVHAWGGVTELLAIAQGRRDACVLSCVWCMHVP